MCFIPVPIFYISHKPCCFVPKYVLASFVKINFPENDKHVGNILLQSQSVIIRNSEKVELEKQCPYSVLHCKTAVFFVLSKPFGKPWTMPRRDWERLPVLPLIVLFVKINYAKLLRC